MFALSCLPRALLHSGISGMIRPLCMLLQLFANVCKFKICEICPKFEFFIHFQAFDDYLFNKIHAFYYFLRELAIFCMFFILIIFILCSSIWQFQKEIFWTKNEFYKKINAYCLLFRAFLMTL